MIISKEIKKASEQDPFYWTKIFKNTFNTPDGKLALLWLVQNGGFYEVHNDPLLEAQSTGRRALVLQLLETVKLDLAEVIVNDGQEGESIELLDRILGEE